MITEEDIEKEQQLFEDEMSKGIVVARTNNMSLQQ